jgi:hypothetical protein
MNFCASLSLPARSCSTAESRVSMYGGGSVKKCGATPPAKSFSRSRSALMLLR